MKITVSGSHDTGKTTLIEALADLLPTFAVVEEPYQQLVEEGHVFAKMPGLEDFELQLERSIETIKTSEEDCIFDRCPLDILAYLTTHEESEAFDIKSWLLQVEAAVRKLDLIVFLPIEKPDRVIFDDSGHSSMRRRVDEELRDIVLDDRWDFGVYAVEVVGSPAERARQVVAYLEKNAGLR